MTILELSITFSEKNFAIKWELKDNSEVNDNFYVWKNVPFLKGDLDQVLLDWKACTVCWRFGFNFDSLTNGSSVNKTV